VGMASAGGQGLRPGMLLLQVLIATERVAVVAASNLQRRAIARSTVLRRPHSNAAPRLPAQCLTPLHPLSPTLQPRAAAPLEGIPPDTWVALDRVLVVKDIFTGGVRTFLDRRDAHLYRKMLYAQVRCGWGCWKGAQPWAGWLFVCRSTSCCTHAGRLHGGAGCGCCGGSGVVAGRSGSALPQQ